MWQLAVLLFYNTHTVTDPIEMVPWLRTFYGHITTIGNDELHQYILNDLRAMEVNYEPV
jgi:hypothetical protein